MNGRVTVAGFIIFIVASTASVVDGWLETKAPLVIQNVILLVINVSVYGAGYQEPRRK